jgi:hypothetical protein
MYILLSKTVKNIFITFGCIPIFALHGVLHYIEHFIITIQAVFFVKCNYGNFILHYINCITTASLDNKRLIYIK